jgi:hypothetical protein
MKVTIATKNDVKYFLERYDGFKKETQNLIAEYSKPGHYYQWLIEQSSFSDPGEDYNKLILICGSTENGEERRTSLYEKGY